MDLHCNDRQRVARGGLWTAVGFGFACFGRGQKLFYAHRRWWRHAVWPLLLLLLIYGLLLAGLFGWLLPGIYEYFNRFQAENSLLQWLLAVTKWLVPLLAGLTGLVILTVLSNPLYELLGACFFDALAEQCERDVFGVELPHVNWRRQLAAAFQGTVFAAATLLWGVVLLPLNWIPLAGQAVVLGILSYRLGFSYVLPGAWLRGGGVRGVRRRLEGRHRLMILAFGFAANLALLVPVAGIFLLPGCVVGGILLYHRIGDGAPVRDVAG